MNVVEAAKLYLKFVYGEASPSKEDFNQLTIARKALIEGGYNPLFLRGLQDLVEESYVDG